MIENFNIDIDSLLDTGKYQISDREKRNLVRLFEFTQYLLDDETNLTKRFNLAKKGKDQLFKYVEDMFEEDLKDLGEMLEGSGES
ncbi:MAG: hypothetical protein ACTSUE_15870 [Promethearchaeota archaeon]